MLNIYESFAGTRTSDTPKEVLHIQSDSMVWIKLDNGQRLRYPAKLLEFVEEDIALKDDPDGPVLRSYLIYKDPKGSKFFYEVGKDYGYALEPRFMDNVGP